MLSPWERSVWDSAGKRGLGRGSAAGPGQWTPLFPVKELRLKKTEVAVLKFNLLAQTD